MHTSMRQVSEVDSVESAYHRVEVHGPTIGRHCCVQVQFLIRAIVGGLQVCVSIMSPVRYHSPTEFEVCV